MDDDEILRRGGGEYEIGQIARQNGADNAMALESETVCVGCQMYTKPFVHDDHATCEFCGATIYKKIMGYWEKVIIPF